MTPPDDDTEAEALKRLVAEIERSQRAEDVAGFVSLFRPDAIWTTATGTRLLGIEAIAKFTRQNLPGAMKDLKATTYEVVHTQFLRHDVAAVLVKQTYRVGDSKTTAAEGAPLYIMIKNEGRWLLQAGQNTPVK